jgi:hypothetical protein
VKRTGEDEPSKARRGWARGRGRSSQNGDDRPAPATPKRSSRSVFGPSGDNRPDVLTDAETVVLPTWLHRRMSSANTKAGASAASLNTITVPALQDVAAQEDEASRPAPGTRTAPGTGAAREASGRPENASPAEAAGSGVAGADDLTVVQADTAAESPGGGATGAGIAGPGVPAPTPGTRPDAEMTTIFNLAELKTAMVQPRTLEAIEAIEAIDALETSTLGGLEARAANSPETVEVISAFEARIAQAFKTIEAMTANAFEAIDATVAEMTPEPASKLVPPNQAAQADEGDGDEAETRAPDSTDPDRADPDRAEAGSPVPAGHAESSPGTDVARARVIRIDEPPVSVTLSTSSTETTIAVPHPRAESTVAVTPTPATDAGTMSSLAQPVRRAEPAALPPSEPGLQAEPGPQVTGPDAGPPDSRTGRRTRVSRFLLLCILALQALMSLRLHNTAYFDEAQYLYSGHLELEHLLHGSPLQGSFTSVYSGSPVLYPVLAAAVDQLGGLTAARLLSLAEMLSVTALLYSLTRRLFNERIALCAALLFCVTEPAIFLGNFATYDATSLFLLALAAWIMVRTAAFRWPVFLLAAPAAALAVGVKYAALLFVPTIAVLPLLAYWPLRSRRVLLYPLGFAAAVGGLLYGGLRLGGHAYVAAISSTTTNRAHGATPVMTLLRETAEWGGVIFLLALIGTAAYVRRVRTEPDEVIAPAGSRFRRLCLGVILTGTALLAPAYQAHLHTDISFQKHVGFGLFFAAPIAGLGLARLLGDHFRRPHIAVGIWCVALVLGVVQASQLYQSWPNSTQLVQTFSRYLTPHGRYLAEEPSVPIYYLLGHKDARPSQFSSTFYISYRTSKGVRLTGTKGYTAAIKAGYFHIVAYYGDTTPGVDAALGRALADSHAYYLAAQIDLNNPFAPGEYFVWVKGHPALPGGVSVHAGSKFRNAGSKIRELAP